MSGPPSSAIRSARGVGRKLSTSTNSSLTLATINRDGLESAGSVSCDAGRCVRRGKSAASGSA